MLAARAFFWLLWRLLVPAELGIDEGQSSCSCKYALHTSQLRSPFVYLYLLNKSSGPWEQILLILSAAALLSKQNRIKISREAATCNQEYADRDKLCGLLQLKDVTSSPSWFCWSLIILRGTEFIYFVFFFGFYMGTTPPKWSTSVAWPYMELLKSGLDYWSLIILGAAKHF